jgi:hypothetical protein
MLIFVTSELKVLKRRRELGHIAIPTLVMKFLALREVVGECCI